MSECLADRTAHGDLLVAQLDVLRGKSFPPHAHQHHQLVWASSGVLSVQVGEDGWTLPPNLALWLPLGTTHAVTATKPSAMKGVYFRPSCAPPGWTTPTLVTVGSLLRELLLYLAEPDLDAVARQRAERVVLDVLQPVTLSRIDLPMPTDPRARAVAAALVAHPLDDRSLELWGREVGASVRTLSRLFVAETGMGFAQWRAVLRVRTALPRLAAGAPIGSVARAVGYDTPSGFVAAFRRITGRTPASFFAVAPD